MFSDSIPGFFVAAFGLVKIILGLSGWKREDAWFFYRRELLNHDKRDLPD